MTDPTYRAMIAEMADELDLCHQCLTDDRTRTHPLAERARALLAATQAAPDIQTVIIGEMQAARRLAIRMGKDPVAISKPYLDMLLRHCQELEALPGPPP